mmetsp:Transcript_77881/g.174605  ORF Transcript_77881/g.174605 Transcript_77881/m.174605 type:complete len:331 (+) Transcript_77881:383-1375(+)
MRPDDHRQWRIRFEKVLHPVRAKLHDPARAVRVASLIQCHPIYLVVVRRIAPEEVRDALLKRRLRDLRHVQGPLHSGYLAHGVQRPAYTPVQAKDFILDNCCQRKPFEDPIELVPARIRILRLLLKASPALIAEPVDGVDRRVLVVPTNEVDLRWISDLQCEEQAHRLKGEASAIHKVTKEEIVHRVEVTIVAIRRRLVPGEEAHEIEVLPMNVPIDLDWGTQSQHHFLALQNFEDLVTELRDLHGVHQEPVWVGIRLPRSRLQQILDDKSGDAGCHSRSGDVSHDIGRVPLDNLAPLILEALYIDLLNEVREVLLQAHEHLGCHPHVIL